ncbi:MAG: NAD-dependent epimerase/dehydratase family protein [Planctomycetota bacterium]
MTTTRRSFLSTTASAAAAAPIAAASIAAATRQLPPSPRPQKPLKLLVLGGTAFLGPHFVRAARANGHEVTLFNRGKTAPKMFDDLEQLRGDRDAGELDALAGREWDAAIDTSGYVPAHVEAAAQKLKDHVGHYQFISTISVYGSFADRPEKVNEAAQVATVDDEKAAAVTKIRQVGRLYGPLKARCEQAAERIMPGRVGNLRPGLIVGPLDRSDRFTYWPWRIDQGGEVLAPGDADGHSQFVDVRDLAAWMLHCVEQKVVGVYNAVGFAGRTSMSEVLSACKCATSREVQLTWASEEFLAENKVRAYSELPLWIPREGRRMVANDKAMANGLAFRPISETIRDTLAWAKQERGDRRWRAGLRREREQELLKKWHALAAASETSGKSAGRGR